MVRQIVIVVTAFVIFVSPYPALAQQAGKVYRIGFLTSGAPVGFKARLAAFREGLRELGYVEGKNIVIHERYAGGLHTKLPALAAELVRLGADVIVTHGGPPSLAADRTARELGRSVPIVFAVSASPIQSGLVASLARPGGNITGLSDSHADLVAKRLAYLKKVMPSAKRVAVLLNPKLRGHAVQLVDLKAAGAKLGITILPVPFKEPDALARGFGQLRRERPDALTHFGYSMIATYRKQIVAFARENRLPSMFTIARSVELGGLMSYGTTLVDLYHRAATLVDKILRGAKPAEMPVEQPTRFYLTLNLKTAKALGITFPQSILLRADRVIE